MAVAAVAAVGTHCGAICPQYQLEAGTEGGRNRRRSCRVARRSIQWRRWPCGFFYSHHLNPLLRSGDSPVRSYQCHCPLSLCSNATLPGTALAPANTLGPSWATRKTRYCCFSHLERCERRCRFHLAEANRQRSSTPEPAVEMVVEMAVAEAEERPRSPPKRTTPLFQQPDPV